MAALDGNAIAAPLFEAFGVETTTASGVCATCGASAHVAQFEVYMQAPGTVARCPSCHSALMVLVTIRGMTCLDLRGLQDLVFAA